MSPLRRGRARVGLAVLLALTAAAAGCSDKEGAGRGEGAPRGGDGARGGGEGTAGEGGPVAVDVATARRGRLDAPLVLAGTTQPRELVSVRARAEAHIASLAVDVGDAVRAGQELGRLETTLLEAGTREAEAGLAGARAERASAQAAVAQAKSALEQARLAGEQAQVEAQRYAALAERGIASRQDAEQRATAARSAEQARLAGEEEVRTAQAQVAAAAARVQAQEALAAAARERGSYSVLTSPLTGRVVARLRAPGDLVRVGDEVLRVGDYAQLEVAVSVSELELHRVRAGAQVPVRLDAFPGTRLTGRIARVSPQADATSRLVPLEVSIPNPDGRIAGGLLARVELSDAGPERVLVPAAALAAGAGRATTAGAPPAELGNDGAAGTGRVFVLAEGQGGAPARVEPREVRLGRSADGQVEVVEGLQGGERVVVRSARPLQPGAEVRPSALSEPAPARAEAGGASTQQRPDAGASAPPRSDAGASAAPARPDGGAAAPAQGGGGRE